MTTACSSTLRRFTLEQPKPRPRSSPSRHAARDRCPRCSVASIDGLAGDWRLLEREDEPERIDALLAAARVGHGSVLAINRPARPGSDRQVLVAGSRQPGRSIFGLQLPPADIGRSGLAWEAVECAAIWSLLAADVGATIRVVAIPHTARSASVPRRPPCRSWAGAVMAAKATRHGRNPAPVAGQRRIAGGGRQVASHDLHRLGTRPACATGRLG
jgi:hypothetical protein